MTQRVCPYKGHDEHWYARPDGSMNCMKCHPVGEAARLAIEHDRAHPPPTFHNPLPVVTTTAEDDGGDS